MHQTLLSTKLNLPALRALLVYRSRLMMILAQAGTHSITLVSAPPGYGKTTLVSTWLSETALPRAWLSLDENDNDPIRFLEYFLTALHQVVPAVQVSWLDLLQGSQALSFQSLMALLINEAVLAGDFYLVLDDFHVLQAAPVLDMLCYLFENAPPGMHVVILSRTDPLLPLARLRTRGRLLEIRAEQLRFTESEITQFYNQLLGMPLNKDDVIAIETRTEGWIAGLQLVGLAMQSALASPTGVVQTGQDLPRFIAAFTGSHAYIMDYLTEEVLRSQPENLRLFLLKTSILERMCAPLCEYVTQTGPDGPVNGQEMLETLERNHLFVTPLGTDRCWYRYHHLFKEVLNRRLEIGCPGQVSLLHQRASEWFEQHGFFHEAIQHAVNASDTDRTARLVEQHGCPLLLAGELATLAVWLAAIEPYTLTRPWLAMQNAWVLLLTGQMERAALAIETGEQLLSDRELTEEVKTLLGSFAAARTHWAILRGEIDLAVGYARRAIELLSVGADFSCALRSVATTLLGDASWVQGKMPEARGAYADAARIGQISGNPHTTLMSNTNLADVFFEQGQFQQAAGLYLDTLQMSERVDGPGSSYAQKIYYGLSRVYYARNRLVEAAAASEQCLRLCQRWGNLPLRTACLAQSALIHRAGGSPEKARDAAAAGESLLRDHVLDPEWQIRARAALARYWLDEGELEKAFILIRETGLLPAPLSVDPFSHPVIPLDQPVLYRLEPLVLILARIYLAQGNADAVLSFCCRQLSAAESGERGKAVMELLILQAVAEHAKKDTDSALGTLERVISMAWPEQAERIFLDEGERMAKLLYQARTRNMGGKFIESLQVGFSMHPPAGSDHLPAQPLQNILVEPLSQRELEVLRAVGEGCSNQEIADRFFLSTKTVKRHISNIYAKLDAKNRTQAVSLARSLKLID